MSNNVDDTTSRSEVSDEDNPTPTPEPVVGGATHENATTARGIETQPPLPDEPPPLPAEAPPDQEGDDGWDAFWDETQQAYYFYNRFTKATQWDNPRIPKVAAEPPPPGVAAEERAPGTLEAPLAVPLPAKPAGGYDPAIHGDYDPNADYAQPQGNGDGEQAGMNGAPGTDPAQAYGATGAFNRFTGKWQRADLNPENFSDESKSRRQMSAFFDVDAAANSHDGKSLRAERANKKLSKKELKEFKEKRREKKEEKRRAWLRD